MPIITGSTTFNSGFSAIKNNSTFSGTNVFSMSNTTDFTITTNMDSVLTIDYNSIVKGFSQPITLNNININSGSTLNLIQNVNSIVLNSDNSNLKNYAYFGSLREFIRVSVEQILLTFPASLYISNEFDNTIILTILNYNYDTISQTTSFQLPVSGIQNKYNLYYTQKSGLFTQTNDIKDISTNFSQYVIWDFINEYPIIGFTGSTDPNTGYLYLNVNGNPFPQASGGTLLTKYHIKPKYQIFELFIDNLDNFSSYLLNRDGNPKYTAIFKDIFETDNGQVVLVDKIYNWKTSDGYNLDSDGYDYSVFLNSLLDLGNKYDQYKTNLIARFLTTSALKTFDTPDLKVTKLLEIYGREFDEIKYYIDSLAYVSHISYDKKDNIPDTLVKNFAKTLGWGTFSTVSDNSLMDSFLGKNESIIYSGTSKNLTPVETDIELWRRLIINSAYLFRSRGTRNCIDFLFKIIGAPNSLVDFNEYVYLVDKKIDVNVIVNSTELNYPFDQDGYPVIQPNTPEYYFQMKGGWREVVQVAPNNDKNLISVIGIHQGDYDNGQSYFDIFRNFGDQDGFKLHKTVDNVKSWVYSDNSQNRINDDKETNYVTQGSKMVLNTKELDIFLDPSKAIEYDVFTYNQKTDFVINSSNLISPYPNTVLTKVETNNISFIDYINLIYSNFINVKNRKVISDNQGGGYSTLKKLYDDYFNTNSNKLNYEKIQKYIDLIDGFWISLIEQFIPSTTIWNGGLKYRNTIFDTQKFVYRHGENDGSEFKILQEPLIKNNNLTLTKISGNVNIPYVGNIQNISKIDSSYITNLQFTGTTELVNRLDFDVSVESSVIKISEPCYTMAQVAKIQTGETEFVIHNISNSLKEIDFTFNCNTNLFDYFNDPYATFKYNIYPFDYTVSAFTQTSLFENTLYSLSGQTGTTRIVNEIVPVNFVDGDYLVKGSFNFSGITNIFNIGNVFTKQFNKVFYGRAVLLNNLESLDYVIDTNEFNSLQYYEYGIYDKLYDYWFTIISNPHKPIVNTSLYDTSAFGRPNLSGSSIVNVQLPITDGQTFFYYNDIPNGNIFLNLNGNTLLVSSAITFSDSGDYYVDKVSYNNGIGITIKQPLYQSSGDILNIIYLKNSSNVNVNLGFEECNVLSIPTGTGSSIGTKIYFNTLSNKYEYYFNFRIDIDVNFDEIIVILNGNKLLKNIDYYPSISNQYKIIFNGMISINDILLFYYPSTNLNQNLFLQSPIFIAQWTVQNDGINGLFTAQITSSTDVNFNNIIYSGATPYMNTGNTYSLYITTITTPNQSFLYRIKSDKYFTNLLGETFTTTIYSDTIGFSTDNRVLGI